MMNLKMNKSLTEYIDISSDYEELISIMKSHNVLVIMGAGVSTSAGIPDFRSSNGRYKDISLYDLATTQGLYGDTETFQDYYRGRIEEVRKAEPSNAHISLVKLLEEGYVNHIVSQNVDDLLERAGIDEEKLLKIHGDISSIHCHWCGAIHSVDEFMEQGKCDNCDKGILRPDLVLFDESLNPYKITTSYEWFYEADTVIFMGTSFKVSVPHHFLNLSAQQGKKIIFMNMSELPVDNLADMLIREPIEDVLTSIVVHTEVEKGSY